jgi:signal transduction histidine kinase
VLNYLFILKNTATDKKMLSLLNKMEKGLTKTNDILSELSDFSCLLCENLTVLDLNGLVTESVSSFSSNVKKKGIRIKADFEGQIAIRASKKSLSKMLVNMLENAARSGAKEIEIKAYESGEDVLITISDDGAGIRKKDAPMVFEPFFTTKPQTLGLGLYFSDQIVRNLGGGMSFTSKKGRGTEFRIIMPRHVE